jgi:predicted RNase H-like nuclease (RuvC/YqgF family)
MFENMVSSLEERVAKIEGILEQMDKRLNHIESEVRDLRNELYREIRDLRKALDYRFYWLLGVQISMWVTIILTIIFK